MSQCSPASKRAGFVGICLVVAASLLVGCGGGATKKSERPGGEARVGGNIPTTLIVERELSGRQLETPLRGPTGIAYDGAGFYYLTDTQNHRILKLDTMLTVLDDAGGFGGQTGLLNRPMYLTTDLSLNILVADYGNRRLCRYNSHLEYVDDVSFVDPEDPLRFGNPISMAVTSYGEIWVSDPERNEVVVIDHVGEFDRLIGDFGYSGGQLAAPSEIILDSKGRFVVCDTENGRLVRYNVDGNFIDELGDRSLGKPVAVAESPLGYWVIDQQTSELLLLDEFGDFVTSLPTLPSGTSVALKKPSDVLALGRDRLIIVDTGNNRVLLCRILYG